MIEYRHNKNWNSISFSVVNTEYYNIDNEIKNVAKKEYERLNANNLEIIDVQIRTIYIDRLEKTIHYITLFYTYDLNDNIIK